MVLKPTSGGAQVDPAHLANTHNAAQSLAGGISWKVIKRYTTIQTRGGCQLACIANRATSAVTP